MKVLLVVLVWPKARYRAFLTLSFHVSTVGIMPVNELLTLVPFFYHLCSPGNPFVPSPVTDLSLF